MPVDPRRVKALFNAALDLSDPLGRPAFLDRECGDDHELRRRLAELLAAYDQPASALEQPLAASHLETIAADGGPLPTMELPQQSTIPLRPKEIVHPAPPPLSLIGTVIAGRYKLRQEIGEGGMGSVYLAEQTKPVKRQVALKLIKAGMDSRTVLARFESERQALALMDHPNIAKVLDAGATESGHPFFVMELVKGIPVTDYCDQHRLGLPERLTLFRQICSAVQHAHQKGIIHRDLKPSNILVEMHDDKPVPKVIDFGLAKATSGLQLTENSLCNAAFGTRWPGTALLGMAPAQATFNALDVDTRADIYALGVILYELLTGSTPIQRDTFKRAALDEMLRVIREDEPPTPSSRLSTSDALPSLAANRHIEPARLSRFMRGDLDWIVMKALAKDRQRRYDSAIGLANDIERFTNHEPVSAGPPSSAYRLRKFVRRNRVQVVAASLVLLALLAGVVGTTLGLVQARRQELIASKEADEKEQARKAEAEQRREAVAQREQAEKRLTQVEKANEILGSIFKDLNPRNEEKDGKPLRTRLGERLDQATAQIEGEAIGDPLTVARMQNTLGQSQLGLGYPEKAIALLTKARATFTAHLGPDHPETLNSMNTLAIGYQDTGKLDRALPLLEETLALRKLKLGPDHLDTLTSMNDLAEVYQDAGKLDLALPLQEETLALKKAKLGLDHLNTLTSMNNLASGYVAAGRFDRALPLQEETLALMRVKLGPDHPHTLTSMSNLAHSYWTVGKNDRALPLFEETLKLRKAKLGPDHPDTLTSMNNLAAGYRAAGKIDRALRLVEETLALRRAKLGPDHPDTLNSMNNLANCYREVGKNDKALPLFEETLKLTRAKLGPDHPETLNSMNNLAMGYWSARKLDRSIPLFEECLKLRRVKSGEDHPETMWVKAILGENYKYAGRLAEALPLLEEANRAVGKYPKLCFVRGPLLDAYVITGRNDEAAALTKEMLAEARAALPADSLQLAGVLAQAGMSLVKTKNWAAAEPVVREALTIREAKEPDAWTTFNTKSLLGGALLGQKKYAEAEPHLRAGYQGLKERADKISPQGKDRPGEALDRLIDLAEAMNKLDDLKMWKNEKARLSVLDTPKPDAEKK